MTDLTIPPQGATDDRLLATCAMADSIAATLAVAGSLAGASRRLDLAGLDDMIGQLCARVLDLPAEQGRALRPRLAELLAQIKLLHGVLAMPPS